MYMSSNQVQKLEAHRFAPSPRTYLIEPGLWVETCEYATELKHVKTCCKSVMKHVVKKSCMQAKGLMQHISILLKHEVVSG